MFFVGLLLSLRVTVGFLRITGLCCRVLLFLKIWPSGMAAVDLGWSRSGQG